jgi:hypothetical protein
MLDDEPASAPGALSHSSGETIAGSPGSRRALEEKAHLLRDSIAPLDSYTHEGVYWADLRGGQQVCMTSSRATYMSLTGPSQRSWVHQQNKAERSREWAEVWAMFKANPFSPFRAYWNRYVLTGMGLFVEGFTLFSIGNLSSLFQA